LPEPDEKESPMSRRCELSGKGVLTGNKVSHSNIKSRRRYLPNLNDVTLQSEALGRSFSFRIAASTLRTVDHLGGLDAYLMKASEAGMSARARKVKKDVAAALAG
jgi:large subunit ribosomal protein L28